MAIDERDDLADRGRSAHSDAAGLCRGQSVVPPGLLRTLRRHDELGDGPELIMPPERSKKSRRND